MKALKKKLVPYKMVPLDHVHPNPWNPNVLQPEYFVKLKKGLKKMLDDNPKSILPIVVRKSPETPGHYQIIDGYHRWKAFGELKQPSIAVFTIKADDKTARILTNTLNYLRGAPDRKRYAQGIVELVELGMSTEELTSLLPETDEDIDALLDEADVTVEAFGKLQEEDEERLKSLANSDKNKDVWIDLKFRVAVDQAKVIEEEIARIGNALKGKNKRGRALELAMVNSSQCDLPPDL